MPVTKLGYIYFKMGEKFDVQLTSPGVVMLNDRGQKQLFLGNPSIKHVLREAVFKDGNGNPIKWTTCLGISCKWCHGGLSRTHSVEEIHVKLNDVPMKLTLQKWMHDKWVAEIERCQAENIDPNSIIWSLNYPAARDFQVTRGQVLHSAETVQTVLSTVAIVLSANELEDLTEMKKLLEVISRRFPPEQFIITLTSPATFGWNFDRAQDVVKSLYDEEHGTLDISRASPKKTGDDT